MHMLDANKLLTAIPQASFTVRRLERRYGKDVVRIAYDKLSGATPAAA